MSELQSILIYLEKINQSSSLEELEQFRIELLGKNGLITEQLKKLGSLSIEEKKQVGAEINKVKDQIISSIENKKEQLYLEKLNKELEKEKIDISLPPPAEKYGNIHPLSRAKEEALLIFNSLGFEVKYGPQIEDDYHNFTALNIPELHPAREMQDTFYLPKNVLRTHTSPVQVRTMENQKPPLKIVSLGATYRSDSDSTHSPMFHQIEGLYIDENINMGHLKWCLEEFTKRFFEVDKMNLRFRPSFFPFTEPSAEVDIAYRKDGDKIIFGEGDNWLEILGSGMVHPNVLKNVGIDTDKYQGFAFGMGIERIAMLKYGIKDLRQFFENDIRWLENNNFSSFDLSNLIWK